jgi:GNAT superfamily N-acetyltransferase
MSFDVEVRSFPAQDGPLRYAKIPWDSESFAHPIYELQCERTAHPLLRRHLPALLESFATDRPVLAWAKIALNEVALGSVLTEHGFYPVETMVELHLPLDRFQPVVSRTPQGLTLRPATSEDLPRLQQLARSAFYADRFHVDHNLDRRGADERFGRWIDRAMRDCEPVFVYEDHSRASPLGFFHVREVSRNPKTIDLSLGAIDAAYQKLGFGLLLYQSVLTECKSRGYTIAETRVSINNLDVLNVFARLGCSFLNPVLTFHWYRGVNPDQSTKPSPARM